MAINREKLLEAAQKFVEKKKYDKAVVELRRLADAEPNDARTLHKIGELQLKQGQYAEAIDTFEAVGNLYANDGFAQRAVAVYIQIREIIATHVPQVEERYGHIAPKLGDLYHQMGHTSDALRTFEEVAMRLQRLQREGEAIDIFRKITDLDAQNPLQHIRLAEALTRARDIDSAVESFKTAATLLSTSDRQDDAIRVLERLLHFKPDPEQARLCGQLYLQRNKANDVHQGLAKLQIAYQANPKDIDTLHFIAMAFEMIGQNVKAVEVQKEMARIALTVRPEAFREIVLYLLRVAPDDPGVRQLAMQMH